MEPATTVVTAKVTRSLLAALRVAAHRNCRTVSEEIRSMLCARFKEGTE
jgi:hypothetical protein